jgi:thioredoxin-like negative regulator of GroEL
LFRLAKINSDNERQISELLGVTGLPTVYALRGGLLTDKFVGLLQSEQLRDFIIKAVAGASSSKSLASDVSELELLEASGKIADFAGMSCLPFKARMRLAQLVSVAMDMDDAWESTTNSNSNSSSVTVTVSEAVKAALGFIRKACSDIRNPKYRVIHTSDDNSASNATKLFRKIAHSPAAVELLRVAGYRRASNSTANSSSTDEASDVLLLQHYNIAVFNIVVQV